MTERDFTLVLGGGGMKGLSHIGVLAALEEDDFLPRDLVASSIGALVSAAWCAGMSIEEMKGAALELRRKDILRLAHRSMAIKRLRSPALYQKAPLQDLVNGLLGDVTFDELARPLIINTVDVNSGMQVFWGTPGLSDIRVADAVLASCALPGFLPPHEIRGRFYMDGAAVSNLPVGIAAARRRDLVIAVDIGSSSIVMDDVQHSGFAAIYARAIEIAILTMVDRQLKQWDQPPMLLLQPRVEHVPLFSFKHNGELIQEGYRAATEILRNPELIPPRGASGIYPKRRVQLRVDRDRCIGCGACLVHGPAGLFELDEESKAIVTEPEQLWSPIDGSFVRQCPTYAILARREE